MFKVQGPTNKFASDIATGNINVQTDESYM